jgi:hypothetical protein
MLVSVLQPHDAVSHYDPNTNRCCIQVTVHTADLDADNPYHATYLYDGQTREMLASATIKNGQKSGIVFSVVPKPSDDNGFGFAGDYIRSKMDDDESSECMSAPVPICQLVALRLKAKGGKR